MRFATVESQYKPQTLRQHAENFDQLVARLSVCPVGKKDGEAIIPAVFKERDSGAFIPAEHRFAKAYRLGGNVARMTGLCADIDHFIRNRTMGLLMDGWERAGYTFLVWETYNHTAAAPRYRVLFPFEDELILEDRFQWSFKGGAWEQCMHHLDLSIDVDQACRDPARLYYVPRKPSENEDRELWGHEGRPLDWKSFLALPPPRTRAPLVGPVAPITINLEELRTHLKRSSKSIIKRALAGHAPTPPPDKRRPGECSRYEAWRRVSSTASLLVPDGTPAEALINIFWPAYVQECKESPEDHTAREVIETLFESALESAPQRRADQLAANEELMQNFRRQFAAAREAFKK